MGNLVFYPSLTDELMNRCGCVSEKYTFFYYRNNTENQLLQKGKAVVKLEDPLDLWKLKEDGIVFRKKVVIAYPDFLHGLDGVACKDAEIGICIIWTNNRLTQTGHILPKFESITATGRVCMFEHFFKPGEIDGDLELSLIMYIKRPAETTYSGEEILMNEEGVSIGEIDNIVVNFDSIYMDFPIEELFSETGPLWWVEFSDWENPKVSDLFSKDNICLYLNPFYASCPMTDGKIKNLDLLIDILASVYMLMFKRLSEADLTATRNGTGLEPNSICSVLHDFIGKCKIEELRFETPESLLKTLQVNIRALFSEEEDN